MEIGETELNVPSRFTIRVEMISWFTGGGFGLLKPHKGSSHRGTFHFNVPEHLSNTFWVPPFDLWASSFLLFLSASFMSGFITRLVAFIGQIKVFCTFEGSTLMTFIQVNTYYCVFNPNIQRRKPESLVVDDWKRCLLANWFLLFLFFYFFYYFYYFYFYYLSYGCCLLYAVGLNITYSVHIIFHFNKNAIRKWKKKSQ